MENKTKQMEAFDAFATDRLNNHLAELNTRYANEKIDKETLSKGYDNHATIFNQELNEKINELCNGQKEQWLSTELKNQKQAYINKLNANKPKN